MSEETWRPLGVESEDDIRAYDALHDGVPPWMQSSYWGWVKESINRDTWFNGQSGRVYPMDIQLVKEMCETLRIAITLGGTPNSAAAASLQKDRAMNVLMGHDRPLEIADYLLAFGNDAIPEDLEALLTRCKSAWRVGTRFGKTGLVRRVPLGVHIASDDVMQQSGRAGSRLAKAWGLLYGLDPDASSAYRFAILAVEDAVIPVISPNASRATLGTVLSQMEGQKSWSLPMKRQHTNAPSNEVLISMMRLLWFGQHDRHGGQPSEPSGPGDVSVDEAKVAVSIAVALVAWFDAGLVFQS
ncbi:hypothetical protein SAMN05216298_2445 [Glycomyces sambucus]|uniref:Abortive infection C-terminus n=1 Tax=Glycomyces sambucus TaxID=380244 RepID=A0A1G9GV42_9ACTN|nr:hypothetical protein [Glycomyces sambucus]SDL04537.1 hypothetical protein SAMN05216298_2445 [Glycomyces sambucus]